jgi:signal transduction histidine kinase
LPEDITKKIKDIPSNPRNIKISFSTLSYKNPLLNKYKYRLIGSDTNWVDAENTGIVNFATLSSGTYTFQVKGSNSDLVWSEEYAELTFTVLPRFYETTEFYILVGVAVAIVLYFTYNIRVYSLQKNRMNLQRIVNEQTATLREQTVTLRIEIEQRKRQEEEILKMKKVESLSLIAGGIAHDFNNLLTAVLGNISLLKYKVIKDDTKNIMKLIESSEKASLRAKNLTQQLLTFSKEGNLVVKHVSLGSLLEECTIFTLRGSPIKSFFDISNDLWAIDADEGQISRVIQNLIVNASQAMPNGGDIYITAKNVTLDNNDPVATQTKISNHVLISIRDTGSGISEENMNKIFDPYFTTKKTAGRGNLENEKSRVFKFSSRRHSS